MSVNLGDAIGYIRLNTQNFMQGVNEVQAQTQGLHSSMDSLGDLFGKFGDIAKKAFAAVTAAATAATAAVVSVGSQFEASMSQVAATMGMTADEIANGSEAYESLVNAAKEMGATTKFTASQAADALNYLALAGYGAADSIEMLPKVLNLAAAGGMDLATASDMVTDAMSALGLSIEQADDFIDQMAKTAQSSNTSVEQLGDAILQIGGTAKSLAGGVTELDTALGILANNGIKAAEGGTALRQIILNLTAPTEKAAAYMEELGFSAYDAEGNMKPLNETFRDLSEIMSQFSTQQERDKVLTTIFDARQLKSARALLANYGDEWDALYDKIDNASGAASIMAETMQQNFQGAMTIAQSALEAIANTIYEALSDHLTSAVQSAIDIFTRLNEKLQSPEMQQALERFSATIEHFITSILDFVAGSAIPSFIKFIGDLEENIRKLEVALSGVIAALPIVVAGFVACNEVVQLAIAEFIGLKAAALAANAALLLNPYTAVAAALGLVVAGIVDTITKFDALMQKIADTETEFTRAADEAHKLADALDKTQYEAEEMAGKTIDEVNAIRTLTNELGEYKDKNALTAEEMQRVEQILDELSELYPEVTAEIRDGQVVGYNELADAVQRYTDKLYWSSQVESAAYKKSSSKQVIEETTAALEGQAEQVGELYDEYAKIKEAYNYIMSDTALEYYTVDEWKQVKAEAKAAGKSVKDYYEEKYYLAQRDWRSAADAWATNKATLAEAQAAYDEATLDMARSNGELIASTRAMGEEVEGTYDSFADAAAAQSKEYGEKMRQQEQENHREEMEEKRRQQEEAIAQQEQLDEEMFARLSDLDKEYQLGRIADEKDYQAQRKAILESNRNEENDKWVKEYAKSVSYEKKLQEQQVRDYEAYQRKLEQARKDAKTKAEQDLKDYEDSIKNELEDLKYKNQIDDTYTTEQMYNDMEEIIEDKLDKESDLYKHYNKEIVVGRKKLSDDLKKQEEDTAKTNFSAWQKSYEQVISEAKSAYNDIEKEHQRLTNSLIGSVDLYEKKTKEVWDSSKRAFVQQETIETSSKALKKQNKELDDYLKTLEKLENRGVSDNLMSKVLGMNEEEAQKFAKSLDKMSDKELQAYSDTYDDIIQKSQEFSDKYYNQQVQDFEEKYTKKIDEVLHQVPEDAQLAGTETINGFIKGIEEKQEESEGAIKDWLGKVISDTKDTLGVHSPSTVYTGIGENLVEGLIIGVNNLAESLINTFMTLGELSANAFKNKFQEIWDGMVTWLQSSLDGVYSLLNTSNQIQQSMTLNGGYGQTAPESYVYNTSYTSQSLTKADVVSAIKEAYPDGNVVLQIDGQTFATIARDSLNRLGQESGDIQLQV